MQMPKMLYKNYWIGFAHQGNYAILSQTLVASFITVSIDCNDGLLMIKPEPELILGCMWYDSHHERWAKKLLVELTSSQASTPRRHRGRTHTHTYTHTHTHTYYALTTHTHSPASEIHYLYIPLLLTSWELCAPSVWSTPGDHPLTFPLKVKPYPPWVCC